MIEFLGQRKLRKLMLNSRHCTDRHCPLNEHMGKKKTLYIAVSLM